MRSRGLAEDEGSDSDSKNGCEHWDNRLSDRRKIPALQYWSSYHAAGVRGRLRFDPFPAKTRLRASEAQELSAEAVKGNPTTTVIPGVDESKPSLTET